MLLLAGLQDEVVPKEHMRELWEMVAPWGGGKHALGLSKYLEFEYGTHSELRRILVVSFFLLLMTADDTCLQPGYWAAVASFISGLHSS